MRPRWLLLAGLFLAAPGSLQAGPVGWGSDAARPVAEGRVEVGLFSESRWGAMRNLELSTHPLWFFILPQVQAKVQWWQRDRVFFSSGHRAAYPSVFLSLVAKEGALGLLPPDAEVPVALILDNHAILTWGWFQGHDATIQLGAAVAPRTSSSLPVLDFPFLYQRFAPLFSSVAPRGGLVFGGDLGSSLGYSLGGEVFWFSLPSEKTGGLDAAWAFEEALRLDYYPGQSWRVSASLRASHAQLPIGWRTHLLPQIDLRVAW